MTGMGHEEPFKSDALNAREGQLEPFNRGQPLERLTAALKRWGDSPWARRRCTDVARPFPSRPIPGDYKKSCSPAKSPKLFRDFVDRSCDQGFRRNTAIVSAQRMPQHRFCLGRRLADVNVAPQGDGVWLPAVSGAALTIDIGLRARLRVGEAGEG